MKIKRKPKNARYKILLTFQHDEGIETQILTIPRKLKYIDYWLLSKELRRTRSADNVVILNAIELGVACRKNLGEQS